MNNAVVAKVTEQRMSLPTSKRDKKPIVYWSTRKIFVIHYSTT